MRLTNAAMKISKDQNFLVLILDKQIYMNLEGDILIGGKVFSCISAIKSSNTEGGENNYSTVFRETTRWSTYDANNKKQYACPSDDFLICVFQSENYVKNSKEVKNSLIYSRSVLHDYFRGKTVKRKKEAKVSQETFNKNNPESAKKRKDTFNVKNPEAAKKHQKTFNENNPESAKKRQETFTKNNPESAKKRQETFTKNNPES